jgi:hypothetical protein
MHGILGTKEMDAMAPYSWVVEQLFLPYIYEDVTFWSPIWISCPTPSSGVCSLQHYSWHLDHSSGKGPHVEDPTSKLAPSSKSYEKVCRCKQIRENLSTRWSSLFEDATILENNSWPPKCPQTDLQMVWSLHYTLENWNCRLSLATSPEYTDPRCFPCEPTQETPRQRSHS